MGLLQQTILIVSVPWLLLYMKKMLSIHFELSSQILLAMHLLETRHFVSIFGYLK